MAGAARARRRKAAREVMVDRIGRDGAKRREHAGDGHRGQQPEHHDEYVRNRPYRRDRRRCGIAGVIEGLVAADTSCECLGPTVPSVTAAMAGGKIVPAEAASACVAATTSNRWIRGRARQAAVTTNAVAIMRAEFALLRSISAPAGVWAMMPASAATDITTPMLA